MTKRINANNKKEVQRIEWIKTNTVTVYYTDASKEDLSRTVFNQIIREAKDETTKT